MKSVIAVAAMVCSVALADEPRVAFDVPLGRLSTTVRPTRYTLALEVLPTSERFSGTVDIALHVDAPVDHFYLHDTPAMKVRTDELRLVRVGAPPAEALRALGWEHATDEVVRLGLGRVIAAGDYVLHVAWDAPFDRHLLGLYRVDVDGKSYAFTQFETSSARRAFPGFDDPGFKTPFELTLTVSDGDRVYANTRERSSEKLPGGKRRVRFWPTPPLPTYLVAWGVGPFEVVEGPSLPPTGVRHRALPVRAFSTAGHARELDYAVRHVGELVTSLEEEFASEYPWDKLDIIAVPDFEAGAMENPGAITGREEILLVDDRKASIAARRRFTSVMAHELAHMWFGDSVTLRWWDDTWLNESFATWMATRTVEKTHPDHDAWVTFLVRVGSAMSVDSLLSARPIHQRLDRTEDAAQAFDSLTYQKGGTVLAMFERWIGADAFRRGVRSYLDAHRFGSATTDDFLAALGAAAGRDVATPFGSFLDEPGLPLVEARVVCDGAPHLALRQSRVLPLGSKATAADRARRWQIPVCVRWGLRSPNDREERSACTLLTDEEGTLPLDGCPAWVMPNAGAGGYYRWSLSPADARALSSVGYARLTPAERLSLGGSLFAAYASGALPVAEALASDEPLARDAHFAVAAAPMPLLRSVRDELVSPSLRPRVERYAAELYAPTYARLGWLPRPAESEGDALLRSRVLQFLVETAHDPAAEARGAELARAFLGQVGGSTVHREALPPELVSVALVAAVRRSDAAFFDALVERTVATTDPQLRNELLDGIVASDDDARSARVRALSLDPRVRTNERYPIVHALMARSTTRDATWAWLQTHFDALHALLPDETSAELMRLPGDYCDAAHAASVRAVLGPRAASLRGGQRLLDNTVERIELCAARAAAQSTSARAFFERASAR